jgi:hypothetical protein
MSDDDAEFSWQNAEKDLMAGIDTSVPVSARIWNYWLGGKDYFPIDKAAGDQFAQLSPGVFDLARATRYYIARVVRYLAGEVGIRQFLDIGTGLPSHDNTHEIAQRTAPESRVVYVDNDPLVLSHARALLTSNAEGTTDYIDADLNHPDLLLGMARQKLDFTRPVAILLMGILGHIGNPNENDDQAARFIVDSLKADLPSGGYLAVYEATDADPAQNEATRIYNESGAAPYHLRRPEQISRFFDGLELVAPGLVPIQDWRPEHNPFGNGIPVPAMGGVAKKE